MWTDMGNMHWGWIGFGALHMVLFWGFIILAIVVLVKMLSGTDDSIHRSSIPSSIEILNSRYARGEIERDEFEQKKNDLATKT
ncbi:MAG: SHOCT domain-containing protein [Gammaproteobacteria bacterium]|nr:SHOCT domain-containing protein [Gammaproteobacteria bacterium]